MTVIHPCVFALLLTLAAIGAPLACSASGLGFSGARIVESAHKSERPGTSACERNGHERASVDTCALAHAPQVDAELMAWCTRAVATGIAAAPPPTL